MTVKRAQVTIFIILGLVVLGAALFLFLSDFLAINEPSTLPADAYALKNRFQTCFRQTTESVLLQMGMQGGLTATAIGELDMQYPVYDYYQEGHSTQPPLDFWSNMIAYNSEPLLEWCLVDENLTDFGVPRGEPEMNVIFRDEDIFAMLTYPIDVGTGGQVTRLERFDFTVPVRFKHLYAIAEDIVRSHIERPAVFDPYAHFEYDARVNVVRAGPNWITSITDERSRVLGFPFTLTFNSRFGDEIRAT